VLAAQNAIIADDKVTGTVRTLLEVAQGVWQPPWVQPHPGLDALKAVTEFGIRIPAAAVDTILALAEPALAEQTRLNGDIAELLLNAYCAVPSRQEDLARAIEAMMRLPDQPDLWMLLRQPPPAHRAVLLPVLRSAADKGVREAGEVLVAWAHLGCSAVGRAPRLRAIAAPADWQRQPPRRRAGTGHHHCHHAPRPTGHHDPGRHHTRPAIP
jgi:hypothetical protein